ncbi:MAG: TetR/AcrR family transcriptional regulator [bacterium]|nr:TetR/AcrR family transcriptional regulator [bacterium]
MSATERREQILDVTHAIVDAEGFHAATPGRIAGAARITRPVLYQQFGDLAGVFVALIDREGTRASAQFVAAIGRPGSLASTFEGVLDALDAHPATWRLFLVPPEGAPPALHERLAAAQRNVHRYLEGELRRRFPDLADPDYTARLLQAAGRELLRLRLVDAKHATNARLGALVRDLGACLLRGTGTPPPARAPGPRRTSACDARVPRAAPRSGARTVGRGPAPGR